MTLADGRRAIVSFLRGVRDRFRLSKSGLRTNSPRMEDRVMSEDNPVVERWARLQGHNNDLEDISAAFQNNSVCEISKEDDGNFYLKTSELYNVEDGWEFKQLAEEFIVRLNGAMAAGHGHNFQPISFDAFVPVHANGNRGAVILAATGHIRARSGAVAVSATGGNDSSEPAKSPQEIWLELCQIDDDLADALAFIGRDAGWFDLFKAYEVVTIRLGGNKSTVQTLASGPGDSLSRNKLELFAHTANTLHRHAKKQRPPKAPMPLSEAKKLVVDLVPRFAGWVSETSV